MAINLQKNQKCFTHLCSNTSFATAKEFGSRSRVPDPNFFENTRSGSWTNEVPSSMIRIIRIGFHVIEKSKDNMAGLAKKVWSSLAAQSDATHSAICVGMKLGRWIPTLPISSFRIDR